MRHRTFTWEAGHTAGKMFTQVWEPETAAPHAVIALVHGQGEHSGRYAHLAYFYTQLGYALMAVDLTGHGKSAGKRGHVASYQNYLDDVNHLLVQAKEQYPQLPVFLYGHSMGGNIVLNYALRNNTSKKFDYLIVTSPWLRLAFDPPALKEALGKLVRSIFNSYTETSTLDINHLSRDPRVPKAYAEDPLVHSKISVEAYFGVSEAGEYAIAHAPQLSHSCLLMHGSGDQITSAIASHQFAGHAPVSLMQYKEWDGLYHELHNEVEWKDIATYIHDWMQERLQEREAPKAQ